MKNTLLRIFFISINLIFPSRIYTKEIQAVVNLTNMCTPGVRSESNTPFSLLISCEDALGNYIGIMFTGIMGGPSVGQWKLADRFWQDEVWASDVTSYVWSKDKAYLYVATSGVYGKSGVYRLNLYGKNFTRLYPSAENENSDVSGTVYEIDGISYSKNLISISFQENDTHKIIDVKY